MGAIYEVEEDSDCFVVVQEDRGYGSSIVCVCLGEDQANDMAATRGDWSVEVSTIAPSKSQSFGE